MLYDLRLNSIPATTKGVAHIDSSGFVAVCTPGSKFEDQIPLTHQHLLESPQSSKLEVLLLKFKVLFQQQSKDLRTQELVRAIEELFEFLNTCELEAENVSNTLTVPHISG